MLRFVRLFFFVCLLPNIAFAMKGGTVTTKAPGAMSPTFASAIGFRVVSRGRWVRYCSGCRISRNTFLTAGHCTDGIDPAAVQVELLTAGGDRLTGLKFRKIENAPSYRLGCPVGGQCTDASAFQLELGSDEQQQINRSVEIASIARHPPAPGEELTLTGSGCRNPAASRGKLTCKGGYSFDRNELTFFRTKVEGRGVPSGEGADAYLNTESSYNLLGLGDSGGCAYDRQGRVVGTNSQSDLDPQGRGGKGYLSQLTPGLPIL